MKRIVIFHLKIYKVGGIETAIYHLMRYLKGRGYEVVLVYSHAEKPSQLIEFSNYGDVLKLSDTDIHCDVCLVASNHDIPAVIKAKKYLKWIHTNYRLFYNTDLKQDPRIDHYITVSKDCQKAAKEQFGVDSKMIYNYLDSEYFKGYKRPLRLLTLSRVSKEKGFNRMAVLVERLEKNKVNYIWDVYGNCDDNSYQRNEVALLAKYERVNFKGVIEDTRGPISACDYVVQLSSFEGFCYSIYEGHMMGKPCIVTNWDAVGELVDDGVNGYILPMDMEISDDKFNEIVQNNLKNIKPKVVPNKAVWETLF